MADVLPHRVNLVEPSRPLIIVAMDNGSAGADDYPIPGAHRVVVGRYIQRDLLIGVRKMGCPGHLKGRRSRLASLSGQATF